MFVIVFKFIYFMLQFLNVIVLYQGSSIFFIPSSFFGKCDPNCPHKASTSKKKRSSRPQSCYFFSTENK